MGWTRRPPSNQKVTANQQKDLVTWAAGAGENYEAYLRFCERNKIPTFTKGYWRQWMQRRRRIIQEVRKEHIAAVAAEARLDRKARVALLEDDVARIEKVFAEQYEELTVDQLAKLMDQKRKTLEAIAKERNEWLQREEDTRDYSADVLTNAGKKLAELREKAQQESVDAEFRLLPPGEDTA